MRASTPLQVGPSSKAAPSKFCTVCLDESPQSLGSRRRQHPRVFFLELDHCGPPRQSRARSGQSPAEIRFGAVGVSIPPANSLSCRCHDRRKTETSPRRLLSWSLGLRFFVV